MSTNIITVNSAERQVGNAKNVLRVICSVKLGLEEQLDIQSWGEFASSDSFSAFPENFDYNYDVYSSLCSQVFYWFLKDWSALWATQSPQDLFLFFLFGVIAGIFNVLIRHLFLMYLTFLAFEISLSLCPYEFQYVISKLQIPIPTS